jgi:ComF family protein
LYPPLCGGCQKPGSRWCEDCQKQTELFPDQICQICGCELPITGVCYICSQNPPPFTALRAWAKYNGQIRNAIHRMKYAGDIALAEILARPLVNFIREQPWQIDLLTAVPLGVARRKYRGYNQASLISLPLALGIDKPFRPKAISRVRETETQVGLTSLERRENVKDAFSASRKIVKQKNVLLVDDITTTGSTMVACANALLEAGAREVFGIALARPYRDQDID